MKKVLKKGFTLIELLVVIAIIAILATVIILNVTGARAKAARAKVGADYSVAAKVAAACASFDGTLTYPADTVPTAPGGNICVASTLPSDATEKAAATGTWPATVTNFAPVWTGTTTTTFKVVVTASGGAGTGTFTCQLTGCTSVSPW